MRLLGSTVLFSVLLQAMVSKNEEWPETLLQTISVLRLAFLPRGVRDMLVPNQLEQTSYYLEFIRQEKSAFRK